MNHARLETQDLSIKIGHRTLCKDLRLQLRPGQSHALLGANGAGKTTLLHTLCGLRSPEAGAVLLDATPLKHVQRRHIAQTIGLLFQDAGEGFPSTVLETVLMGRHPHLNTWSWESEEDKTIARAALEQMELLDYIDRDNRSLSGGERQRLALATLLTQQPRIALLDEPTNHLDPGHQVRLLRRIVDTAKADNMTLMMSLHDPNLALRFCDRALLLLDEGKWIAGPSKEVITAENLEQLYGHPMQAVTQNNITAFLPK